MVKTLSLNTEIRPNRELKITLPSDVPVGPAKVVVVVASHGSVVARTLGDLSRSEFFGMYRDRNCSASAETLKLIVPAHRPIKRSTLAHLLKQAKLTVQQFKKLS